MSDKLFGTDGIRGRANELPMTADMALHVAMAAGQVFRQGGGRSHTVLIGKDTRLSGYMLETAMTAGFTAMGMDVILSGPIPTPAVATLTRSLRADIGVVISASHNAFEDNGIKLFGADGYKLADALEAEITRYARDPSQLRLVEPADIGQAKRMDDAGGRYIEFVKGTFPRGRRLDGMTIVVDCAHGAAHRVAPRVFYELGAHVIPLGVTPDGTNINMACGATAPEAMCRAVWNHGADLGVALDGDADRVILADEHGCVIDGDQIMALLAHDWHAAGRLTSDRMVATVMSNLGLERYLAGLGLGLERTRVGDRFVVERMRDGGSNLGGEQSGHIVLGDYSTTGDGLICALQVLAVMVATGKPASALGRIFEPVPQKLTNVHYDPGAPTDPLSDDRVTRAIETERAALGDRGRLVIRPSGTEPVIRVMAEADDPAQVEASIHNIAEAIVAVGEPAA